MDLSHKERILLVAGLDALADAMTGVEYGDLGDEEFHALENEMATLKDRIITDVQ